MQRGKAPATSYKLMVSGRVVARGLRRKELPSPTHTMDSISIAVPHIV
jgi:hypothetical protein